MKNISLEEAELTPSRMGMGWKLRKRCLRGRCDWKYHTEFSYSWVPRFINKFNGKPYNLLYSKFLEKLDQSRIYKKGYWRDSIVNYFYNLLHRDYYRWHRDHFSIDDNGIVRVSHFKKPVKKEYKVTYKLHLRNREENMLFINLFGHRIFNLVTEPVSRSFILSNLPDFKTDVLLDKLSRKRDLFYQGWRGQWFLRKLSLWDIFDEIKEELPIVVITKAERRKSHAENISKNRKKDRELKRKYEVDIEQVLHEKSYNHRTKREQKKWDKISNSYIRKAEEKENNITRDRLGFNEESFRNPQKFT